jgi:hypothetical protein
MTKSHTFCRCGNNAGLFLSSISYESTYSFESLLSTKCRTLERSCYLRSESFHSTVEPDFDQWYSIITGNVSAELQVFFCRSTTIWIGDHVYVPKQFIPPHSSFFVEVCDNASGYNSYNYDRYQNIYHIDLYCWG